MVLDTDVVVAAMRSPRGASAELLRAARSGGIVLLVSVPLAIEYEAVCHEAEHRLAAGLSEYDADLLVTAVIAMAEAIEIRFLWRPQLRDPGDEMVLETAINGAADALVTFNARDYGAAPTKFGIELLVPRDAIRRIRE